MITLNKYLFCLFFILMFALANLAQDKAEVFSEANAGFTFEIPKGWRSLKLSDNKYAGVFGEATNGYNRNIAIVDDVSSYPLAKYVDLSQKDAELNYKNYGLDSVKFISRSEFVTASRIKGLKLVYTAVLKDKSLTYRQYIFQRKPNFQLIFTCGASTEATSMESICDNALKSLNFTN